MLRSSERIRKLSETLGLAQVRPHIFGNYISALPGLHFPGGTNLLGQHLR
jgi:hypothetical protein